MRRKITFPRIGNYDVPFRYFISRVFDADTVTPPVTTKRTMELGATHSPDFVCSPFKYNLGNYIEALKNGADTLVQFGGPCRLGYYGELHEQILRDLGYEFEFINLAGMDMNSPTSVWAEMKKWNPKLTLQTLAGVLLVCVLMVEQMDELEKYIRKNVGFEEVKGSFDAIYKEYLKEAETAGSRKELKQIYAKRRKEIDAVKVVKPANLLKVGIVGEYYTIMEPFSNRFIEKELAAMQIYVTRSLNISSTVFHRKPPKLLRRIQDYVKYDIGATGIDTVNEALRFAKKGYDGIIHVKSFGCTPEIDAMTILQNVSRDYKIPILYFSFDSQTSDTGIKTRLEAFHDMMLMRKEK